ncbi:cytochrome c family protein [Marinicauda salina]|uniref:Cytochrome c family protein n=1 Tax=Marinicauda salina TaxID=2135793 RepID=A0A2U2BXT8_9PROT|nr:cytochrome c family protein [Marinicauda salina]PWE18784.1 cytochrome c family protein [Marinicauda salina]
MGDLFFNKVAGAVLAILLVILALRTLSEGLFHAEAPEEPAYPIDLAALEGGEAEEEEEEGPLDLGALLASADVSAGERVARRCAACHTFEEGGANGTGPNLWDVVGRAVAGMDGFNYSNAMQEYAEGGTEWMFRNLYDYLENPRGYVPGTAMSFAGLRQQEDRINMIAYLHSLSNDPEPLPEPLPEEEPAEAAEAEGEAESETADAGEAMEDATEAAEAAAAEDEAVGEEAAQGDGAAPAEAEEDEAEAEAEGEPTE